MVFIKSKLENKWIRIRGEQLIVLRFHPNLKKDIFLTFSPLLSFMPSQCDALLKFIINFAGKFADEQ